MPSVADLIFIAFLSVLAFTALSVRLLGDAGIGWHIRTGQLILSTHAIPRVDPFSASMAGQPWFAWEWLYDIAAGGLDRVAGLNGVVALTAIVIAATFSFTFRLLTRRGTSLGVALLLTLLAASASMIHFFARPHVFSWLFCVIWFWILDSSANQPLDSPHAHRLRQRLWLLPLLMLFWVNLHGGFLLGFALLGIFFLSALWQSFRGREKFEQAVAAIRAGMRAHRLALVGGLCAIATLANPYGWNLHLHIYRYLSSRFLMDHIDEFQSPNFHGTAQKCFAVLLLLTLTTLAVGKRERLSSQSFSSQRSDALIILFAVYTGLYSARNLPVSSLLLILVVGPRLTGSLSLISERVSRQKSTHSSQLDAQRSFFSRMQAIDSQLRGHVWPLAAILLTGWIALHAGKLGDTQLMKSHFDARRFPVAAIDFLQIHNQTQAHDQADPIFAPDSRGGYLIYRLYPHTKVIVDDRHDFYGESFLKSYLDTIHVEPDWQDFLVAHNVRCIVVPKDSALRSILLITPSWKPIYSDETATVFTLNTP